MMPNMIPGRAIQKIPPHEEDWFIDRLLHEAPMDFIQSRDNKYVDLEFNWNEIDADTARRCIVRHPADVRSINLTVADFAYAEHYSHFMYDDAQMPMVEFSNCVVCNQKMVPISALCDRRGQDYLTLGLCPQCGFFQHIQRPTREWYADFYRKTWDVNSRNQDFPTEVPLRMDVLPNVVGALRPPARVLEIGCGWGGCINTFKRAGYDCVGVESTSHRSEFIRSHLGIPCFTGEAENLPIGSTGLEPGTFDLIFSTNVLEHVYSTRQVLEHVHGLLRDNGFAYFAVPTYYQENLTLNTHALAHTCNFSHANFVYLLQSIGYDIVRDFSNTFSVRLLLRKAPPLTVQQKQAKLAWMSTFLPSRGLATILERNGLVRIPANTDADVSAEVKWFLSAQGKGPQCFLRLKYLLSKAGVGTLQMLKQAVRSRTPLENLRAHLPVRYLYNTDGVPIWIY